MTKEFEVEVRLRNNRLKQKRIEAGFPTPKALAQAVGISYNTYIGLENLHAAPTRKDGSWREAALKVCIYLGLGPDEAFPPAAQRVAEKGVAKVVKAISAEDVAGLVAPGAARAALPAADLYDQAELTQVMSRMFTTLTPREERVLRARFGIGADDEPHSRDEIGEMLGISGARVSQIEARALRKLRHPTRSNRFREFYSG